MCSLLASTHLLANASRFAPSAMHYAGTPNSAPQVLHSLQAVQ